VVVVVTMPLWLLAGWLGGALGLPPSFAFLFDLVALAAFLWAIIVLLRVWRATREDKD